MSSSPNKRRGRYTLPSQRKKIACSTPVETIHTPSSLSASGIDASTSSDTKERIILSAKLEQKQIKRREDKKKENERKKKKKRRNRKKECIQQRQSDDEWRTFDESLREPIKSKSNVLFEDLRSPEQIREAPCFVLEHLDSPILRSHQPDVYNQDMIIVDRNREKLPVLNLPFSNVRFDGSDDEETVLTLKRENIVKTYPGKRNERTQRRDLRIEKCREWLVNVSVPTVSSDLLWNNFVSNNRDKIGKYLARPSSSIEKYGHDKGQNINNNKSSSSGEWNNRVEKSLNEKSTIPLRLRESMTTVRGHWDKSKQKWIRIYDVYNFSKNVEEGFNENSKNGEKITLNQFLKKCRAKKSNTVEMYSSSTPTQERSVTKNLRSLKHKLCKETNGKKRNLELVAKNFETKMVDVPDLELKRINKIRKFAPRSNTKNRTITFNETSSVSTSKNSESNKCILHSLKRTIRSDENRQVENKKLKLTTKNKPTIKSTETLVAVRYQKQKESWRII